MAEQLTYRDAHEVADTPLRRAQGLLRALYDLASESPQLGTDDPHAIMLCDLIACAEEKVTAALDAHEAEFKAAVREIRDMANA